MLKLSFQEDFHRAGEKAILRHLRNQKPHERLLTLGLCVRIMTAFEEHYQPNGRPKE